MGFNISGIAINKNYQDRIAELKADLGLEFEFKEEISFQEASANWKDEEYCDIYFSEGCTLIFMHYERCLEPYSLPEAAVFTFAASDVSGAYVFGYFEGVERVRTFMEMDGERFDEFGDPLPSEADTDASGAIINQIGAMLGFQLGDEPGGAVASRYVFE